MLFDNPETAPTINVNPQTPTVFDSVSFWLTGAYQTIKSVVWSFGAGVADLVATVANGISTAVSQAFDTSGAKTVTATYKDSTGTTLGTVQTNLQVQQGVVQKTAAIAAVKTDTGVVIPANTTVVSTKPVISGTTSAALTNTEVVLVYDGTVVLGRGTVTDTNWTYSATTPLAAGVHSFKAVVARVDGLEGTPSAAYLVTISGAVSSPSVTAITPLTAIASTPTSFTITGQNLPLTAVMALADGTCQTQTSPAQTATGFTVVCTPGSSTGSKVITISTALSGGTVIDASKAVAITAVATPSVSTLLPATATASTATTFTITGQNLPLTAVMALADGTCQTQTSPAQTATGFTVVCTPGSTTGSKLVTISTTTGGAVIDASRTITVSTVPVVPPSSGTGLLTDTGITANQCFQAGSNVLVSCTSAAAIALNASQDGMVGRDVSSPSNTDGKLGFSYSTVPNPAGGSFAVTECVKDNITGLTWEGKTATGTRAGSATYTNYDNLAVGQVGYNISTSVNPTQAQIDAPTNTVGYKNAVNASALCGYTNWRLPTVDELESLVDYGVAYDAALRPTIDATWFPNTAAGLYWSSSPYYMGSASGAWSVAFGNAGSNIIRDYSTPVRLVR